MLRPNLTRRGLLEVGAGGMFGLALGDLLALRASAAEAAPRTRPKSVIVLFAWGGMSHLDTFDPKPDLGAELRGEFKAIDTRIPGVQFCEHLPKLAQQAHRMAVVRSVNHPAADHRMAAYWSLTGHKPPGLMDGMVLNAVLPTRRDWPSIGSMVAKALDSGAMRGRQKTESALPGSVCVPYPMAERGLLSGQFGGFLGAHYDPAFIAPRKAVPYEGVSPLVGNLNLDPVSGVDLSRIHERRALLAKLDARHARTISPEVGHYRERAFEMLLDPTVRSAFDLEQEPAALRERYGAHVCGQSMLMARRLVESGVPLVTVTCSAGDLNGSAGAHFDGHADLFNRMKKQLLPPMDQAGSALLDDLSDRGMLEDTLVVWLTEFGRTPVISPIVGRDHFPGCYSVAFAGGGVRGGQVYGRSNKTGSAPVERPCGPEDLHATIFKSLGIDPDFQIRDSENRPFALCEGKPLDIF
jgi:hypothetical protein